MKKVRQEIGRKIRNFRKSNNLTLSQLSEIIHKSQSTICKYETGEISVDIETLYEIARALKIHVYQLLYTDPNPAETSIKDFSPAFFDSANQFYSYVFDGRSKKILKCVFDILSKNDDGSWKIAMYMNFKDYDNYQICENTYLGFMEHYDAVTNIYLTNQNTEMEKARIQILASYLDAPTKWGLFNGFSSRPMMPIAIKMLFSKTKLKESLELQNCLMISKEDIRLLKHYNMFSST